MFAHKTQTPIKKANTGLHPTINKKVLTDENSKHVRFI